MVLHLIPDDGAPHAPTTECGCGPVLVAVVAFDGTIRQAFEHPTQTNEPPTRDAGRFSAFPGGVHGDT